jgi:hypothetical protein
MAFRTEWLHDPYILATTFTENLTATDLKIALLEYVGAAHELSDMYFLLDLSGVPQVPNRLLQTPLLLQVVNHGNTRWLAVVKPEDPSSYMTRLLTRDKLKTFRDRESARAFLENMVRLDLGVDLKGDADGVEEATT